MNCAQFEQQLSERLAGEIDRDRWAVQRRELLRHVDRCDACAASEELLQIADLEPSERDSWEEPADWDRINRAVHAQLPAPARSARPRRWWAVAALLLVGVGGGWLLRSSWETTPPAVETTLDWAELDAEIRAASAEEREALLRLLLDEQETLSAMSWQESEVEALPSELNDWLDSNEL